MRFILFALFVLPFHSLAQNAEKKEKLHFSNKVFVKVSPLTIIDNKGGVLPVSFEYTYSRSWGVQVDVGVPLLRTLTTKETKQIDMDYRLGIAVRKYLPFNMRCRGFAGFEALYRRQESTWGDGTYNIYDTHVQFSSANTVMQSKIISTFAGIQVMIGRKLFLEPQLGLGINFSKNEWSNVKEVRRYEAYVFAPGSREDRVYGSSTRLYVPARITFSYLLSWRSK